ncbi:MAG: hypothetical protein CMJ76_15450 [Planctomycetaceae bacterium]|nr:hypothetical protein [Planctomycetaceae bacterium]|tara:strand:+ start:5952 stop:6974 length:1023 start_codon:yes stop_codon:yes gene_type:complete
MSGGTELNWSILGLGRFGRIHARTLQTVRGVRLHSACNRNEDILQHHAAELQLTKISTTAADILADSEVDVVSIVTHWQDHYQLTLDALSAGKHVFLEKPMAATDTQAREILAASKKSKGLLMVGHICRFDPRYILARERILAGEIGEITSIHAKRNLPVAPANIRLGKIPPLVGDGIHDLDLAMWMLDRKPNSVFARNIKIHDFTYPDAGWAMFDFSDPDNSSETLVVIETHWGLPETTETVIDARMEIIGTSGKINIDCSQTGLHIQAKHSRYLDTSYWPQIESETFGVLRSELEYFANCIKSGSETSVITNEQACDALEMILLAQKSADQQQMLAIV